MSGGIGTGKTRLLTETARLAHHLGYAVVTPVDGTTLTSGTYRSRRLPTISDLLDHAGDGTGRGVLVVVDDVEAADPQWRDAALYVLANTVDTDAGNTENMVFAASETHASPPAVRRSVQAPLRTVALPLAALAPAAAMDLAAELAGGDLPDESLAALVARCGRLPLLVTELLVDLLADQRVRPTGGLAHLDGSSLPHRLCDLVGERIDRLSCECQHLLKVAAMHGRVFRPAEVADALRMPEIGVLEALDKAIRVGILTRTQEEEIAFTADVLHEAVLRLTVPAIWVAFGGGHVATTESAAESTVAVDEPADETVDPLHDRASAVEAWTHLSETEKTIAKLVSEGLTNRQVAKRVFLSPHTVNYHLRQIFRKFDVISRVELAALAGTRAMREPRTAEEC